VLNRVAYERTARAYDLVERTRKDYEDEARQVESLVRRYLPSAGSLLDVASGTGGHLAPLAGRFEAVAGIELSETMIEESRRSHPGIDVRQGDMRTFRCDRRFDAVVCLFSSVGYMTTPEDLTLAVANMAAHLSDPGVLVIEGWFTPDKWRPGGVVSSDAAAGEGMAVARVIASRAEGPISVLDMHWLVASFDGIDHVAEEHRLRMFTATEYRAAIVAAGLEHREADGLTGRGLHVGLRGWASPGVDVVPAG
jgi:hypothetical protein